MVVQQILEVLTHFGNIPYMLSAMGWTLTGLRTGMLHARLLTNKEPEGHEAVAIEVEASFFRSIPVALESLPGAVVQFNALSVGALGKGGWFKIGSFVVSAGSVVAVTSAIDVRKDGDQMSRLAVPHFFGVIPSTGSKRTLVIFGLRAMAVCQFSMMLAKLVLMKELAGGQRMMLYLLARQAVFHLNKLARGDWTLWIRVPFAASIVISFVERSLLLEMGTNLSMLICRHPFELGSLVWSVGQVENHLTFIVMVCWFLIKANGDVDKALPFAAKFVWTSLQLQVGAVIALVCWYLGFLLVLKLGNNSHTFNPWKCFTAKKFLDLTFELGDDFGKANQVFGVHDNLISAELRVSTQAWLDEGWEGWEAEKPSWFDEGFKLSLVESGYVKPQGNKGDKTKRRSSVKLMMDIVAREERKVKMAG